MSDFSYTLPTLSEINSSLEKTLDLIKESEKITQKHLNSSILVGSSLTLYPSTQSLHPKTVNFKSTVSKFDFAPNPMIANLHFKNLELAEENRLLANKLKKLDEKPPSLASLQAGTWKMKSAKEDIDVKLDISSSNLETNYDCLTKQMAKTSSNFKRLEKKIEAVERMLRKPYDRHCARCLPNSPWH